MTGALRKQYTAESPDPGITFAVDPSLIRQRRRRRAREYMARKMGYPQGPVCLLPWATWTDREIERRIGEPISRVPAQSQTTPPGNP